MRTFLIAVAALFLGACASAPQSGIVSVEVRPQATQEPALTAQTTFPITCMLRPTFDAVTGRRDRLIEFQDKVEELNVTVHVERFTDVDGASIILIYHTFTQHPDLVCVLHASPNRESIRFFLEGLV